MKFLYPLLFTIAALICIYIQPAPAALQYNLIARLDYNLQTTFILLGAQKDYNVERLYWTYSLFGLEKPAKFTGWNLDLTPIEIDARRESLTNLPERVNDAFSRHTPLIVRGMLHVDKTTFLNESSQWGLDYILNQYKETQIPVFTNMTNDHSAHFMPFNQFAHRLIHEDAKLYGRCIDDLGGRLASSMNISNLVKIMNGEFDYAVNYAANGGPYWPCLFMGSKNVRTRMHSDLGNSAFINVQGRKRWTMFPSSESMYFLSIPHAYNVAYNSRIDIFAQHDVITRDYPFAALAHGWNIVLEAGDVMFFPAFIWHGVENLDTPTIALDNAVYGFGTGFPYQPLLTMGTAFNPFTTAKILGSRLQGQTGAIKRIFFDSYVLKTAAQATSA